MNLSIRPYKSSDKEVLLQVLQLNVPDYFAAAEVNDFEEYLERMSSTYLVAEIDGRLVGGFGYEFRREDRSGRINWIFFHPDRTGRGIGRKCVEHCLRILEAYSDIEKHIVRTTQLACGFFGKCGYEVTETKKDYWAPGFDLYLMERSIKK